MSSWGLALLCGLAGKLAETGRDLRIACPRPFVMKYLKIFAGTGRTVRFHVSREEAVRPARPRRRNGGRRV